MNDDPFSRIREAAEPDAQDFVDYVAGLSADEVDEAVYRFEERAGIAEDSGASPLQAERIAAAEFIPE